MCLSIILSHLTQAKNDITKPCRSVDSPVLTMMEAKWPWWALVSAEDS
jgi:hypothetical protein